MSSTPAAPDLEVMPGFRFSVVFLTDGGEPNHTEVRFQRVSGLAASITTTTLVEGGENLFARRLPDRVERGNLILQRGHVRNSRLDETAGAAFSLFEFKPAHVIVTLLDERREPLCAWQFFDAYPVSWSISDLDATKTGLVIDTLELAYTRMQQLRL